MAQVAFLTAMVSPRIAAAAAQRALEVRSVPSGHPYSDFSCCSNCSCRYRISRGRR